MFNLDDYKNILDYFKENGYPDDPKYKGLKKTIKKLEISYEEINFRQEASKKLKDYQEQLAKVDEDE